MDASLIHASVRSLPSAALEQPNLASIEQTLANRLQNPNDELIMWFQSHFSDRMEMYADAATVMHYLSNHQEWFSHCAHPMHVDPIGNSGYALGLGRLGALGYELEPKFGVELSPQESGSYHIYTIPVPEYTAQGYGIDFQARLQLVEIIPDATFNSHLSHVNVSVDRITYADWQLDLTVHVHLPHFLKRVSQKFVQQTGDRVLSQIVRQISRRLTHKVQEDFHLPRGLPMPKPHRKQRTPRF